MDRLLYISMTGARQNMLAQGINANNLANVSTPGFKADFLAMRAIPVFGEGHPSRAFALTEKPGTDFSSGVFVSTGRDLDVAVQGNGWIAVQKADGSEAYTRAGALKVTNGGVLTTASGQPVMGESGPISIPPFSKMDIGSDGTISIVPAGAEPNAIEVSNRIKLVNPDNSLLKKSGSNLYEAKNGETFDVDDAVRLETGVIESSNVSAVTELVDMIDLSRQFEMQVKMMREAEKINESAAQMLRIS